MRLGFTVPQMLHPLVVEVQMKANMGNIETNFCHPLWKKGKASTIAMTNTGMGTFILGYANMTYGGDE